MPGFDRPLLSQFLFFTLIIAADLAIGRFLDEAQFVASRIGREERTSAACRAVIFCHLSGMLFLSFANPPAQSL